MGRSATCCRGSCCKGAVSFPGRPRRRTELPIETTGRPSALTKSSQQLDTADGGRGGPTSSRVVLCTGTWVLSARSHTSSMSPHFTKNTHGLRVDHATEIVAPVALPTALAQCVTGTHREQSKRARSPSANATNSSPGKKGLKAPLQGWDAKESLGRRRPSSSSACLSSSKFLGPSATFEVRERCLLACRIPAVDSATNSPCCCGWMQRYEAPRKSAST
mmetsp:Transcript_105920/g.252705  ORF Transcript_105920/g.252705 Transcript_105920/m.252705 type:complete len:219 (+) Transcript_105920:288-944(+)